MAQFLAALLATHLMVGTAICAAFAKAAGFQPKLWVCFAVALAASLFAGTATVLLFSLPGLDSLPGSFMQGGLVTLLLMLGVFTVVWVIAAALVTTGVARRFLIPSA